MHQATDTILMIRPAAFGFNHETEADNVFQSKHIPMLDIAKEARREFDQYVDSLRAEKVDVLVIDDSNHPQKPDAIFPNNWFSTHDDGTIVTYPMYSEIRRAERSNPVIEILEKKYLISKKLAFENFELENRFLEGTGSIIFDHIGKVAYACQSRRTDKELFLKICEKLGHRPVFFKAKDAEDREIYHTNVMLSLTSKLAIVCAESIVAEHEERVIQSLSKNREILLVTLEQMHQFCCNVLEVINHSGRSILTMSTRAFNAFEEDQIDLIEEHHKILHSDLTTIETIGGGGSRCMMAEIFLKLK